jgi:hypothetical protein
MKIEIALHSIIDLITNSSTEIFTDFAGSLEPCKEMINEMFKSCGIEKTCDEVFTLRLENEFPDYDEDDEEYSGEWKSSDYSPAMLIIETKDPKFEHLGKLISKFLESGESKEFEA